MNLSFTFEPLFSNWSVQQIFNRYYNWFVETHPQINSTHIDTARLDKSNPSGIYSPHLLTIRNTDNQKYILVSYWDKAAELTWKGNGWDYENCVDLITSAGVRDEMKNITPSSYATYSLDFENSSEKHRVPFNFKNNNELLFRGHLYEMRYELNKLTPNMVTNAKIPSYEYVKELNESQICLSLNGAGEICNRDIEIFSVGSVLFRPELNQNFNNPLIPNVHYVTFDSVNNPIKQLDIIKNRFKEIRVNYDFLNMVANNGLEWYKKNGTIQSNVEILKDIIKIEKLI